MKVFKIIVFFIISSLLPPYSVSQNMPISVSSRFIEKSENEQQKQLEKARLLLRGKNKKIDEAKNILTQLTKDQPSLLSSNSLFWVYFYLGYAYDISNNRKIAQDWYKKAKELNTPMTKLADYGLRQPIRWIKHLDENSRPAPYKTIRKPRQIGKIGKGIIFDSLKKDLKPPKTSLTKEEQLENFEILVSSIDQYFSFFNIKKIDWKELVVKFRSRVKNASSTNEFYVILNDLVKQLNDAHSWLCNFKRTSQLRYRPPIHTRKIQNQLIVSEIDKDSLPYQHRLRTGAIITKINGMNVSARIKQMSFGLPTSSSKRNFIEEAYRKVLYGKQCKNIAIEFTLPDKEQSMSLTLDRTVRAGTQTIIRPPFRLKHKGVISFGVNSANIGYIRIHSFNGREEIATDFEYALTQLRETSGLIIDVRENRGGYGTAQSRIIGRLIHSRTKTLVSYIKNGPLHNDFYKNEVFITPKGDWQYTKPIALLINSITGSASDLFVAQMKSLKHVKTIGSTTHGNVTGTGVYVKLPCELFVRISNGYITDTSGEIIEGNGNIADIPVMWKVQDIIKGNDPVIQKAVNFLKNISQSSSMELKISE